MTIKLGSLSRWALFPQGALTLAGREEGERRIRIQFNCEAETALYRVVEGVEDQQLVVVVGPGAETVEFVAAGEVGLIAVTREGAQVWYQTADTEPTHVEVLDPVIFTRIANRRHRNPEMEEMMFRMQQNMERRLAQTAGEIEAAFERRRREEEHGRSAEVIVTNAPGAAANGAGSEVRPQEPSASQSGLTPGSADGSQQTGDGTGAAGNAGTVS